MKEVDVNVVQRMMETVQTGNGAFAAIRFFDGIEYMPMKR